MTELVHWRAIFLLNLPVALLGLCAALRVMPDHRGDVREPLDVAGFLLFGAGVASVSHGLGLVSSRAAARLDVLGWAGCGVALLAVYARRAAHHRAPVLRLGVLRTRTFRVAVWGGFLSRLGIGGMPFLLPLFYQVALGRTPLQSALLMLPQPAAAIATKLLQRAVIARVGYRHLLRANTLLIGIAIAAFATVTAATPAWRVGALAFVYGALTSLQFTSVNSLQFADLAPAEASTASTLASVVQQLSLSCGVALASGAATVLLGDAPPAPAALGAALRSAFLALGAITATSSATFALLHPGDGRAVARLDEEPRRAA